MRVPCVYILASRPHGTLYIGVTANIAERLAQHRRGEGSAFVRRYAVTRLVHVEFYDSVEDAIRREKTPEALAQSLENPADRALKSTLGGFGPQNQLTVILAKARTHCSG